SAGVKVEVSPVFSPVLFSTGIGQIVFPHEPFAAGETKMYSLRYPAGLLPTGVYTVKVGLFSTDWSTLLHWDNHAFAFVVGAAPCSMGDSIGPTLAWNRVGGAASPTVAGAGQVVKVDTFVCPRGIPFLPGFAPNLDVEIYDPNGVQVLQEIVSIDLIGL